MQQRHGRTRLKTPQRIHAAALLQVQQLDQDDRVDIQKAAVAGTDGTSACAASSAAMERTYTGAGSTCRAFLFASVTFQDFLQNKKVSRTKKQIGWSNILLTSTVYTHTTPTHVHIQTASASILAHRNWLILFMPFNTNTLKYAEGAASAHQWITRLCLQTDAEAAKAPDWWQPSASSWMRY